MKKIFALFYFAVLISGLSAKANEGVLGPCHPALEVANYCAQLDWVDGPYLGKKSHFQLSFWAPGDEGQSPISPEKKVHIYSWMKMANGHHHGGPKLTVTEIKPGVFEVKDARFFMHGMNGSWEIRVDLGPQDQARYGVDFSL